MTSSMEWPPRYSENFTPNLGQEYWSPELETMPPAERDKHILAKLKSQVHYAFENSGFYQEFYKDAPVDPAYLASLEELAQLPILTKEDIRREQELYPPYGRFLCVPTEDIFRVHGTSGTTGRPKGPVLSHCQFLARWITQSVTLTFAEHDRYLNAIPLYFGGGRSFSMSALYTGATVILFPPPYEPKELIEAAARHHATTTLLVPTLLRRLLEAAGPDGLAFPSLRLLLSTGAVLHPDERADVMDRLCPGFINYYGSTEGGGVSVLMPHHPIKKASSVGATVFGVDVEIVDSNGCVVAAGEIGHIRYRGPGIADGFYRDPEASAISFSEGWFYPGDLGRLDCDGFLHLAGRTDDVIIRGGVNIYPAEIEETLLTHSLVRDVSVIGIPSVDLGEEIIAFVVAAQGADQESLIAYCRAHLALYKVPKLIEIIDELPKTALGKVVKSDLVSRSRRD